MSPANADSSVRVVVRIRPQMPSEKIEMCEVCTHVLPELNQISLGEGEGRSFTFDSVCDIEASQVKAYELCALDLINGLFEGYNATLIAYGQTGSGKTYTMGTSFDLNIENSDVGIVPRSMDQLFSTIAERVKKNEEIGLPRPEFSVSAQFMELYNEELFDLLNPSNDKTKKSGIKIHEDGNSNICVVGLNSYKINSKNDAIECLKIGTLSRSTASTLMNVQSSRSHAIFTIFLQQRRYVKIKKLKDDEDGGDDDEITTTDDNYDESNDNGELVVEMLSAKFNFVDLAGSERLKRTGATGERAREGISINCGLLALGNVISALGDPTKIGCHVPYRDSKLTRILQDSLGGNSHTTMIACISPSDRDFMETLNTLKYANRARNIRNKVVVNKDMTRDQMIQNLKAEVNALRKQLDDLRGGHGVNLMQSDMAVENKMLLADNRDLRSKVKAMNLTIDDVTARNVQLQLERDTVVMMKELGGEEVVTRNHRVLQELIKGYVEEAEDCRTKFIMAERHLKNLTSAAPMSHRSIDVMSRSMTCFPSDQSMAFLNRSEDLIKQAKQDLENLNKIKVEKERTIRDRSRSDRRSDNDNDPDNDDNDVNDDAADDDDDFLSSGSETEVENVENIEGNLVELSCEISIKQKLIDELIESQKRMRQLKLQYEDKIYNLEEKIKVTEQERDRVFHGVSEKKGTKEETKRLRKEYEEKLNDMKEKLMKLNAGKREHKKLMLSQGDSERRLSSLQNEMLELKRIKVKLMRQLENESHRNRQMEQKMKKEIATIQKLQRTKDVQLKNLQVEKVKKDTVLKRKIQEVEALKKREKFMSDRRSSARKRQDAKRDTLSWDRIEKMIDATIRKKQALKHLDRDMEKWMKQREILCRKLDQTTERLKVAEINQDGSRVGDLVQEVDKMRSQMNGTQDSIHQCQICIMGFEENKDDDLESMISSCPIGDVLYFLERCTTLVINKGISIAQKEEECKELHAQLQQERMECQLHRETVEKLICEKVEVEVNHGIFNHDDPVDRCVTPTFLMIDSLEELQNYQFEDLTAEFENVEQHNNNVASNKNNGCINKQAQPMEIQVEDIAEATLLENKQGFITDAESNYSTPSAKLHLVHCKTALGHNKAVLSLQATKSKLYSSSKDATVKVWDLEKGLVVSTYHEHPGSVVKVRFSESLNLVFAASTYVIKVWDPRISGKKTCVATLTSSGSTIDQSQLSSGALVSCPPGETNINNIACNFAGTLFFSSAGNFVRIWDTRMFKPASKLYGGHQSSITTMALVDVNQNTSLVATGSKDNSIRVYTIGSKELGSGSMINPRLCLTSCHSDNIESMCFNGANHLFSGARDMTISKWDLSGGGQHRQTIQNAHRSWVTSMCCGEANLISNPQLSPSPPPPSSLSQSSPQPITSFLTSPMTSGWLLTSCQSGTLRLWSASNLTLLSEYKAAHQGAINSLAVGGACDEGGALPNQSAQSKQQMHQLAFTASNDRTINIWKVKSEEDK